MFYDYITGKNHVTQKQKQAWVYPNSPLALKVSAALRWRGCCQGCNAMTDMWLHFHTSFLGKISEKVCILQRSDLHEDVMECSTKH